MNKKFVKTVLKNNGYDLEEVYDDGIESGTEEWMDVVSEITNEDPYNGLSENGGKVVMEFINVLEEMGIEMW